MISLCTFWSSASAYVDSAPDLTTLLELTRFSVKFGIMSFMYTVCMTKDDATSSAPDILFHNPHSANLLGRLFRDSSKATVTTNKEDDQSRIPRQDLVL